MIFEIFQSFFILGWICDFIFLCISIRKLLILDPLCLLYLIFYLFIEYIEYFPFFDYMSKLYIQSYKNYFKYEKYKPSKINKNKKEIFLLGPHGMFITSIMAFGVFNVSKKYRKHLKLFVSPTLIYNPIVNLFSKIIQGGNKVLPLDHKTVVKNLKEHKYNFSVSIGGFEELNLFRDNNNIVYTGRWEYWVYHAIKYNFCYCYGGSQDYKSLLGDNFLWFRELCAKNYIPCNLVYGKWGILPFNNVKLTEVMYQIELPYIPNITKEESKKYFEEFRSGALETLLKSKPDDGQDPFVII